jgi:hypothetical protein
MECNLRGKRQDPWRKANDRRPKEAVPTLRKKDWIHPNLRSIRTGFGESVPAGA